jgi:bifunctional non-homologous end joining protein LigD
MHVEDHPIEYGTFEGIIPKGQYGGGTVMLWDAGTWEPEGDPVAAYHKGMIKFTLKGKKVKGKWMLLQMRGRDGGRSWLLVKERDAFAKALDEVDVTEKAKSVLSRRSMEQIAKAKDKVWKGRGAH